MELFAQPLSFFRSFPEVRLQGSVLQLQYPGVRR